MSQQLHNIDRPDEGKKYTKKELDKFMVFCILDTAVPYEMVCKSFDALEKNNMTTRDGLKKAYLRSIIKVLKDSGYRFHTQHAKRLKLFSHNPINLKTATRKEIVSEVNGVGMKLASMFLRNTRNHKYAVLDVHTLRWLRKNHIIPEDMWKRMTYEDKETMFILDAEYLGKDPMELDLEIWQENRIGNRKK